jgi:hypothetical protein
VSYKDKGGYELWTASQESKPLTMESLQACWDSMQESFKKPPKPPQRIVSYAVYKRAEEALADGAGPVEVEYILLGASRETAKAMAEGR